MINKLLDLAKQLESSWLDYKDFSIKALQAVNDFELGGKLETLEDELAKWMLSGDLPEQVNVYNTFGQPPVTVFNNGKFVIDIYFWMHVDTSIHSHSFSGAFKVLSGRSIHEVFKISETEYFSSDVMSCVNTRESVLLLETGDCREIISGLEFNHRLIHLDAPTVTLCVRTISDTEPQWHHFSNGLSIEKKTLGQDVYKKLFYYQYLFSQNQQKGSAFLDELIDSWSISTTLNFYEQLSFEGMGLDPQSIEHFFNKVISAYGDEAWFKMYEEFYEEVQGYIEYEGSGADLRLMEHAINTKLPFDEACGLLERIQGSKLSDLQTEQLSVLKL